MKPRIYKIVYREDKSIYIFRTPRTEKEFQTYEEARAAFDKVRKPKEWILYYSKPTLSGYLDSLGDSVEYPNLIQTEQVQEQQEQILQIADDALTAIKELDTLIAVSDAKSLDIQEINQCLTQVKQHYGEHGLNAVWYSFKHNKSQVLSMFGTYGVEASEYFVSSLQALAQSKGKGNAPCAELTHALARGAALHTARYPPLSNRGGEQKKPKRQERSNVKCH